MALITGEVYSEVVHVGDPAAVAGRVVFISFLGEQGPYPGCKSNGYDIKFSTVAAPTVPLPHYRLRFSYPDGTVAKGNFFAQYMVRVPSNLTGDLLVQWGHAAAVDTSGYWGTENAGAIANGPVHQLPNAADCNALEVWQMTEAAGNFTGAVSGTLLTLSGNATHRQYDDQPFAKRSHRINAGTTPTTNTTALGMYTNTTGYAQAAAGFLDAHPANLTINFGMFYTPANVGDVIGKYNDANNYWRLEQIGGGKLKLSFCKAGTLTTYTTADISGYTNAFMVTIMMGDAGLELLINATPVYRNSAVTGVPNAGSTGRLTIGNRDTGSLGSPLQGMMCMTLALYSRRLTYAELGYLSYHCRPPLNLVSMCDRISFEKVLVDGTATGESNLVQEFDYLGVVNGVHHAVYHGGTGSADAIFHMTGTSAGNLVRDGNGPRIGGGVNGEAGPTLAIAGHRIGDAFMLTYNNDNLTSNLKYVMTSDFVNFSTPATLIAKRTGDWPTSVNNTYFDVDGPQKVCVLEGPGVNPGQFACGAARGPDLLHLTLDPSTNNGSVYSSSAISTSLMYGGGFGANNGNNSFAATVAGGACIYRSPDGVRSVFLHGHAGGFDTADMSFAYMRRTVDFVNYEEHPCEVIIGPLTEVVAGADQLADFCITDLNGTINPIAWAELYNNAGHVSKICQFRILAGTIEEFITSSPALDVPASRRVTPPGVRAEMAKFNRLKIR